MADGRPRQRTSGFKDREHGRRPVAEAVAGLSCLGFIRSASAAAPYKLERESDRPAQLNEQLNTERLSYALRSFITPTA
jgi:hypothetical protein